MPKQRGRTKYPVAQVQDFLNQLRWELVVDLFENTARRGTLNRELRSQLRPYVKKYDARLRFSTRITGDGEACDRAREVWRKGTAAKIREQLSHLDALSDLFGDALKCARRSVHERGTPTKVIGAHAILKAAGEL